MHASASCLSYLTLYLGAFSFISLVDGISAALHSQLACPAPSPPAPTCPSEPSSHRLSSQVSSHPPLLWRLPWLPTAHTPRPAPEALTAFPKLAPDIPFSPRCLMLCGVVPVVAFSSDPLMASTSGALWFFFFMFFLPLDGMLFHLITLSPQHLHLLRP